MEFYFIFALSFTIFDMYNVLASEDNKNARNYTIHKKNNKKISFNKDFVQVIHIESLKIF